MTEFYHCLARYGRFVDQDLFLLLEQRIPRIAGLKAIRDQARAEAEHGRAMLESAGHQVITLAMVQTFAAIACERMRVGGGYRRDHLRALAQRVVVADGEVRIMGS